MSAITKAVSKPELSLKKQTLAAIAAIAGAVAVPQLFHVMGAVSGLGTALGEVFLPMHLPVILAGMLAGPYAGFAAGLLGPLASSLMTGMPGQAMLPFMMIELCVYGAASGLLRSVRIPDIAKLIIVQFAGRAVRALAVIAAVYVFGSDSIRIPVIWNSILTGIPGLVLQWSLLPLIIYRIENMKKHER